MDWKTLGNVAALVGVLVAMVVMFNQVNGRLDRIQAENNSLQTENNRRFDDMDRRFDQLLEALRASEGRITHLEEKVGLDTNVVE